VLAFPRGLAGLVTDQIVPFISRLTRRGTGYSGAGRAEPAPAE
jgi:hypothetical protein